MLGQAGWLPARRFADTLVLASPFVGNELGPRFAAALDDFSAAVKRRNLRELACSPGLFAHYRELNTHIARHAGAFDVAYEDFALAGRPVALATMRSMPASQLAWVRACYEAALLAVLREREPARVALDQLEGCLAALAGPEPYDVWRLAAGCARALRMGGRATSGEADMKRFHARCNLLLADQARGLRLAPRSFVRAALALLWRDYALYGAAAEDADHVALLNDYGLTVDWHVAGTQASEAVWEARAAEAEQAAVDQAAAVRELGVLSINARAYENFLQTADTSMAKLANRASPAKGAVSSGTASDALQSSEGAYGLGAAACALGLGHVAALADALGLAWRLTAHAREAGAQAPVRPPEPAAIDAATHALRGMLLRVAAGVTPPESAAPLEALVQAIESAVPLQVGRTA
jgi:hypothetical protein